eukprot:6858370-Lingulodinium_polyedra.AAC.1
MGVNCEDADVDALLEPLALRRDAAAAIAQCIRGGKGLLEELDIPPRVHRLLAELHNGTWFVVSQNGPIVTTASGVRQGC